MPVVDSSFEVVDFALKGGVGLFELGDFLLDIFYVEMTLFVILDELLLLMLQLFVLIAEVPPVYFQLQSLGFLLVSLLGN